MAMTMTRTRTQTTLTKLVQKLAEVKGEKAFVEAWMNEAGAPAELARRRARLEEQAQALMTTLLLFDSDLDVERVAASEGWRKRYRAKAEKGLRAKYACTREVRHGG